MNPPTHQPVMTLEETLFDYEGTTRNLRLWIPHATPADAAILTSALHHLEAGKDKRYTPQDMIFAAAFGINKLGENFPELKPTASTAPEVKG